MVASLSVTADLIFLVMVFGGSSRKTQPAGEDLLILAVGSARSNTFAASATIWALGMTNVFP